MNWKKIIYSQNDLECYKNSNSVSNANQQQSILDFQCAKYRLNFGQTLYQLLNNCFMQILSLPTRNSLLIETM